MSDGIQPAKHQTLGSQPDRERVWRERAEQAERERDEAQQRAATAERVAANWQTIAGNVQEELEQAEREIVSVFHAARRMLESDGGDA